MASLIRSSFRALALALGVGVCVMVAMPASSAPPPTSDPQPAPESGDAVPTQLPLKLLGTMTSSDPKMSLATVYQDTTQHSRTVWTGSKIQGAKVLVIGRTRIWLSNKGRVEFLEISPRSADPEGGPEPSSAAAPAASPAAAPRAFGASLQQTGPDTYVVQRRDVHDIRPHQKELVDGGERKGAYRNGQWLGIKVVSLVPGSVYERMGLKAGDILLKANGLLLGFPPKQFEAIALLKTATRIDLDIERDGQIIRKTYILQD